ncbi:unnamed protein product [Diamesa serratosioi]
MSRKKDIKMLEELFNVFKNSTKQPEIFLSLQNEKAEEIKAKLLKPLYDYVKTVENNKKSKALQELIVSDMDEEQIWQQLELQNEEMLTNCIKSASRMLAGSTDKFDLDIEESSDDEAKNGTENGEEESENEAEDSYGLNSQGEEEDMENNKDEEDEEEDSDLDLEDTNEESTRPKKQSQKSNSFKSSEIDDKFFKLSEMEDYCDQQDRNEMNSKSGSGDVIDYFGGNFEGEKEDLKYSDFFDSEETEVVSKKNVKNNDEEEEEEDYADDYIPRFEENQEREEPKSSFELKQDRLKTKIQKMESQILDDKPWQLKGEVKADNRPQNSLLENILEFDMTTRAAPVITEETTLKLEDIIRQRIKDKAFDDVERKVKPSDVQYEYKKQLVLDQEKSKQSLAQVYEKDYLKELEKANPDAADVEEEEPKEHKEIRLELKALFDKLDLLSNFFYTPKPAHPELRIITNIPSINMEEVAPVATSNAALLAPEEIRRKPKGDIIGKGERSKTDKNRERRQKKVFQKVKRVREEEKATKDVKFQTKLNKKKLIEKVSKGRNVEKMKESGDGGSKSSATFFSKLQDEVSLAKQNKLTKKRKTDKTEHNAKKIKL